MFLSRWQQVSRPTQLLFPFFISRLELTSDLLSLSNQLSYPKFGSWGFQLLSCISKLESQIKDLLTSCSQRQGNEHDIRDHIAAVHLIWF